MQVTGWQVKEEAETKHEQEGVVRFRSSACLKDSSRLRDLARLTYAPGRKMEARIDVITLAVADLERALAFYRDGLGLESRGVIGTEFVGDEIEPHGAIAMFELQRGMILCLYPRSELAKDAKIPPGPPASGELSIGHAVASRTEVDAVLAQARAAGATLTDEAHDRPWGIYSGYFRDLDGHLWEVLWNPQLVSPHE